MPFNPPDLVISTVGPELVVSDESASPVETSPPISPVSPTGSLFASQLGATPPPPLGMSTVGPLPLNGARRPSDAATLAPSATSSHRTLHPSYLEVGSARSRSSSVGDSSMMSGSTVRPDTAYTTIHLESAEDALRPDPGTEADFEVLPDSKFAFSPGQLNKFLNPKSLAAYKAVGGIRGLERGLHTDVVAGLSVDEGAIAHGVTFDEAVASAAKVKEQQQGGGSSEEMTTTTTTTTSADIPDGTAKVVKAQQQQPGSFVDRIRVYGHNMLPQKKAKSIFKLMWEQYQDKVLLLLTAAAVISLALGLYEALGVERGPDDPPSIDWVEGVAICVAIFIVVIVGSLNDWQKERQFVKLNAKKEDRLIKAIRSGKSIQMSVHDILVGDVLHLEPGDMIPADGIYISGHNLKCDESSATGESDQMKKTSGDEVFRLLGLGNVNPKLDPFMISGSKVLEGVGTYLVTSVGVNSSFGKLMVSLNEDVQSTPLQVKLAKMADAIAYLGGGASLLLFVVLFIRYLAQLPTDSRSPAMKGEAFMDILIVCITLIVVAVPEGLPLAVTLALAFATTRMLKENNLVRVLRACETMGNATTICSDKTGTLTQNRMTVVAGTVGIKAKFDNRGEDEATGVAVDRFSTTVRNVLRDSIVLNSTAFEGEEDGKATFIGSKTETAMLTFARDYLGMGSVAAERDHAKVAQMIPFDSGRKCMGVVVKLPNGRYRLYVKGASEILLAEATRRISSVTSEILSEEDLSQQDVNDLNRIINDYAERSLRTIAMLYKDYAQWPPVGAKTMEDPKQADFAHVFNNMTFLGIVGIQDPLRDGVEVAVQRCQDAGVVVRMVTGDNMVTARSIATECGIYDAAAGHAVMEGPRFRTLTDEQLDDVLPNLRVLARSSPEDKRILVKRLKELGETVAVTGDGTNDGPALKMADVGFSMGIAGTEVAKEASSIILMDDNFSSIVKAIMWGRAVNDAVRKFLQFQLTVNITAVCLTFVSAVASSDMESVLTAVQLLWVNLIMDTFAALALATDAPTEEILDRKPTPKRAPLVSLNMWKMIIGQAIFQLAVTYIQYFGGKRIFTTYTDKEINTIVFNTFVWMQIFNEFNNRRLDNKLNIFEGMFKNYFFLAINAIMIGGQIMIIFVGGAAFSITPLNGPQWAICIIVSLLCIPWGVAIRYVPDELVAAGWDRAVSIFGPPISSIGRFAVKAWRAIPSMKKKNKNKEPATEESEEGEEAKSTPVPRFAITDEETGNKKSEMV